MVKYSKLTEIWSDTFLLKNNIVMVLGLDDDGIRERISAEGYPIFSEYWFDNHSKIINIQEN